MYILHALGYEMPPMYETRKEARKAMNENVKYDKANAHYKKLSLINHSKDHKELKIGCRQGIHTYSEYWITEV